MTGLQKRISTGKSGAIDDYFGKATPETDRQAIIAVVIRPLTLFSVDTDLE